MSSIVIIVQSRDGTVGRRVSDNLQDGGLKQRNRHRVFSSEVWVQLHRASGSKTLCDDPTLVLQL